MDKMRKEFLLLSRFSIVGIIAAIIHIGLVWLFIAELNVEPVRANTFAFLIAFGVSFLGQYFWTFRTNQHWLRAIIKFFTVSFIAFGMNNLLLLSLLKIGIFTNTIAAIFSASIIPVVTYLFARFWVFQ